MFEETYPVEFGPYHLLEKIGQGGMAEIFRAESYGSQGFVKEIAIKRILSSLGSNQDFVTQFLDEARIAGSLSHPNIVQIYDVGHVNEAYYIAMEYVNGKHLGQVIRQAIESIKILPLQVAALTIKEVAQALHFAHAATDSLGNPMNIVHRDISPQNILVDYHGAIKLTDFGIAKAANKLFQTTAGVIKGKFSYLSPEQLVGQGASSASDLFSLGVVFWEMLSGRRLFQGESDIKTIQMVQACDVPQLSEYRSDVPDELVEIVGKLLSANPKYRYQDANLLVRDLSYFLTNNGIPEGPSRIADFMGSLYPQNVRTYNSPPTKASLPAISMDELASYADGSSTQDDLSSFVDATTPVATEEEMTNPGHQNTWQDGPHTATRRPSDPGDFDDDIQTAAIDMSPLLDANVFGRDQPLETAQIDTSLLEKVTEAAANGMEDTALLVESEETIPLDDQDPVDLGPLGIVDPVESSYPSPQDEETIPALDDEEEEQTEPPAKPDPPPVKKGSSNGMFIGIVVVLLLTCGGVWGAYVYFAQQKQARLGRQTPPPAPSSATLEVEIDPPQAKVTINGLTMTGSPTIRTQAKLVRGLKYRIHAVLKGYKPQRMPVTLNGKITRVRIKLVKE